MIYDASTAETPLGPQPYFAMELIRGVPLDKHAEASDRSDVYSLGVIPYELWPAGCRMT
jgi:hypothetical protein